MKNLFAFLLLFSVLNLRAQTHYVLSEDSARRVYTPDSIASNTPTFLSVAAMRTWQPPTANKKFPPVAQLVVNNRATFYLWDDVCPVSDDALRHIKAGTGCWEQITSPYLVFPAPLMRVGDTIRLDADSLFRAGDKRWIKDSTARAIFQAKLPGVPLYAVTTADVTAALGFTAVPQTRALTIFGVRQDLSADRTWSIPAPTYNNAPARTLNSAFLVSATKPARVSYTVSVTTGVSLLNNSSAAQVFLEIATASTGPWTTVNGAGVARTVAVAVSVGINETTLYNIQGEVPAGFFARLRTATSGGGTAAFSSGQEVVY